jgi:hypothetical protein
MDDESNPYDRPPEDAMPEEGQEGDMPPHEEGGSGTPALINLEVWPDAQPGAVKTFKCVKRMEKEIELVPVEEGEEHGDMPPEPEMAGAPGGGGMMD